MRNLVIAFAVAVSAVAQNTPPHGVRIEFLPPPLDGTLSVGVYSTEGKLVRKLFREATDDAFTVGLNGFITHWDGKDDSGKPAPAGKYFVRGYAVGEVAVEGVAFHGNDCLGEGDNAPRIRSLGALRLNERVLSIEANTTDARRGWLRIDLETNAVKFEPSPVPNAQPLPFEVSAAGKGGSVWTISPGAEPAEKLTFVVQRKAEEVLRELIIPASEPKPLSLAAAIDRDEILLLEQDASQTRIRGLRLKETKAEADGKAVSDWEVFLSKSIHVQESFSQVAPLLGRDAPKPEEKMRVALMPNELLQVAPAALYVTVTVDEQGSFLRSTDGLPLRRLTGTSHLKWATLARKADSALSLFQSDGAVTEEFRLHKLDQMMAFDAGEYDLTPAK
jgi:hypothetical protein